MHPSAMENGRAFFDTYVRRLGRVTVAEIGSQDVNGSLREVCPDDVKYIGLDFQEAKGVDVLLTDPYSLPLGDESADVVASSSCFEHSEMFWLVFTEVLRILKPGGLFYLNVPSNGPFHRYPVDCWRFYPDAGGALAAWGKRCGYRPALLESHIAAQAARDIWNDFIAVFVKDESRAADHPYRMAARGSGFEHSKVWGEAAILGNTAKPQDMRRIDELNGLLSKERQNAATQAKRLADIGARAAALSQAEQRAKAAMEQAQKKLKDLSAQNAGLAAQIEEIRNSRSWKVTAPLRAIKRAMSGG